MRGAFLLLDFYRHISHEKPLPASACSLFLFLRHTTPIRWQTPIRCILDLGEMKESLGVIMYEFLFSCWKLDRVATIRFLLKVRKRRDKHLVKIPADEN